MRAVKSSATTMPLSTSIPSAMIIDMIEMRWSSTPRNDMHTRPSSMAMGTKEPTMSPVRIPRKRITTMSTISSDW